MSYIALARKWRPRTFSELIGQNHVSDALAHALEHDRLHHAYLFTGTRGIGKTSVARLLAKSLNCEQGPTASPCLTCESCLAIEAGNYVDLIEIDGASKTRVEDTREVLENVAYAPTQGSYKIYLIDEVHMLSQHSFNALLKTLEEPPAHVKFLLATTDPQKLPVTVLSRCLQFHLRELDEDMLSQHIELILNKENINYEPAACLSIAKAARGSVRDALSLLDQCIAGGHGSLLLKNVNACLGYTQQDYAIQILHALAKDNFETLLSVRQAISKEGGVYAYVLNSLMTYLHEISIMQAVSSYKPQSITEDLSAFTRAFSQEDTQLLYQIALKGNQELPLAPTPAIGFEMTLLRMAVFKPKESRHPECNEGSPVENVRIDDVKNVPAKNWTEVVNTLKLQGLARHAIEQTGFVDQSNGTIILRIVDTHQSLFTSSVIQKIEEALSSHYQTSIKVKLDTEKTPFSSPAEEKKQIQTEEREKAANALDQDPFFNQLKETFSAKLIKDSIESVKDGL